jgi:flagellar basal-body rod protein FlgG
MVSPQIEVPPDTDALQVSPDGSVIATSTDGAQRSIGRLKLVQFANPEGLQPIAGNILLATVASGAPIEGTPGESGMGTVVAGALEMSNIDTREEYLRIVQAQRAYELNVRALKTMDEMLGDAQNLRRQ